MRSVEERIDELIEQTGYGQLWSKPEIFHDEWQFRNLTFRRVGLSTEIEGFGGLVGSASGPIDSDVVDRAFFELLERAATLKTMKSGRTAFTLTDEKGQPVGTINSATLFPDAKSTEWRYAISNGIAAHWSAEKAWPSAKKELIERDRILRSWYGQTPPEKIDLSIADVADDYEIHAAEFGEGIVGIFGIPTASTRPLIMGFGNGIEGAKREMLQRLTFLWDEEIPSTEPAFATNAGYHQDFYLNAAMAAPALRSWLAGDRQVLSESIDLALPRASKEVLYVDITPPELGARVSVIKAVSPSRVPLVFGKGNPALKARGAAEIERLVGIHPIA